MWYEILPPLIIASSVAVVPQWAIWHINEFFLGNPMRRDLHQLWDRHMFTRDCRISGAPWKNRGLQDIPDD
ncbi:uncharacterized protein LOC112552448 [Pogonomyrmex barbatus]|uniref:Uncharacterized protein LOC112552448 n=1 Tax=Pogonomyrmex barbatus TaxID=144034 RepID=A0A8N1S5S6_9HYME|nr:uncharacterized protein LOC112552448 [Pogonomyrmex barbatus]